jgi:hypothetical protein
MKIHIFLTAMFLLIVFASYCQELPEQNDYPLFRLSEFSASTGSGLNHRKFSKSIDFQIFAPESIILANMHNNNLDFADYYNYSGDAFFSFLLGMKIKNTKNPIIRMGVSYFSALNISGRLFDDEIFRLDTLNASNSGVQYYKDSLIYHYYDSDYTAELVHLDLSVVWYANPDSRWSFYAGAGLTAGFSLNNQTSIDYQRHTRIYIYESNNPSGTTHSGSYTYHDENEIFSNNLSSTFSLYIPLGLDFRIGKNRAFWNNIHLFYDLRPAINFVNIPESGSYYTASFLQAMGVRFIW